MSELLCVCVCTCMLTLLFSSTLPVASWMWRENGGVANCASQGVGIFPFCSLEAKCENFMKSNLHLWMAVKRLVLFTATKKPCSHTAGTGGPCPSKPTTTEQRRPSALHTLHSWHHLSAALANDCSIIVLCFQKHLLGGLSSGLPGVFQRYQKTATNFSTHTHIYLNQAEMWEMCLSQATTNTTVCSVPFPNWNLHPNVTLLSIGTGLKGSQRDSWLVVMLPKMRTVTMSLMRAPSTPLWATGVLHRAVINWTMTAEPSRLVFGHTWLAGPVRSSLCQWRHYCY